MYSVKVRYGVVFGKGDATEWIDAEVELNEEEEGIYKQALLMKTPLSEIPELQPALDRAYKEIEEMEIQNGIDNGEEFVLECVGEAEVDPVEINELVANRDKHTLKFFGLQDMSDEELDDWDANDLDELPLICDFVEDFEPGSPYDYGWGLNVEFVDPNEEN